MKNLSLVMLGAVLGFGTMALTGGGASAGALQPLAQQNVANDGIILVAQGDRDRRMRCDWNRNRDGRRCSERFDNCRHFHNGYYYETPWWTLPLIIGGGIAANSIMMTTMTMITMSHLAATMCSGALTDTAPTTRAPTPGCPIAAKSTSATARTDGNSKIRKPASARAPVFYAALLQWASTTR